MIVNEKKRILAVDLAPPTRARVWWLRITWALTFWIPTFLLKSVGRMKRADVRIAWREKLAICMMIFGLCGVILFYIIVFGRLICPDKDKAWTESDLGTHTGTNDYYAAIQGQVYDVGDFLEEFMRYANNLFPVYQILQRSTQRHRRVRYHLGDHAAIRRHGSHELLPAPDDESLSGARHVE